MSHLGLWVWAIAVAVLCITSIYLLFSGIPNNQKLSVWLKHPHTIIGFICLLFLALITLVPLAALIR